MSWAAKVAYIFRTAMAFHFAGSMKRKKLALIAASALMVCALSVGAQVTVGHDSGLGNCYPFGCSSGVTRYQQVYAANAFAGPISISTLTFYHTHSPGDFGPGVYDIYFSVTSKPLNSLASVSGIGGVLPEDFDSNVTGAETLWGSFALAGDSRNGHPYITFSGATPFRYDPSDGNLLFDVAIKSSGSSNTPLYLDTDLSGTATSRAWEYRSYGMFRGGSSDTAGLVTTFGPASSVPEPLTARMLATGLCFLIPIFRRYQRHEAETVSHL